MKKRILSIFLLLAMVICAIPAMSLVSFAAEEPVKDYDYYKHLWYDDGHLVSFVDINSTIESFAPNTEAGANEDASILYGSIGSKSIIGDESGTRTFVKILGGKNAGKYYLLNTYYNHYISGGAFNTSTSNGATNLYELVDSVKDSVYAIHLGETFTYEEATAKGTGASDAENSFDEFYTTVGNIFTVERVSIFDDDAFKAFRISGESGSYNRFTYTSKLGTNTVTSCNDSWFIYRPVIDNNTGTNQGTTRVMIGHNNANTTTAKNFSGVSSKSATVQTAVTYTITGNANGELSYAVQNTVYDAGASYTAYSASDIKNTTNLANRLSETDSMLMSVAQEQSNIVYNRIYDCVLTDEQLAQNHFADLCYYYKLDISLVEQYAQIGKIDYSFYKIFANYNVGKCDAATVALMQKYVNDPDYDPASDNDYVLDAYTQKYIDLYYNDGHLMAFLSLANIAESETVYLDGATVPAETTSQVIAADGAVPEDARLVIGQKNAPYNTVGVQTHSFIKILGGKYAGKYFMLGSDAASPQIELTSDGFVKPYAAFSQFGSSLAGIYFSYAFDISQINTKFSGLDKQGELAGTLMTTTFATPSLEAGYTGNHGTFTVEQVVNGAEYYDYAKEQYLLTNPALPGYFTFMVNFSGKDLGCMRYPVGNVNISDFGTGSHYGNDGASALLVSVRSDSTFHGVYSTRFTAQDTYDNSMFILDGGRVIKATGGAKPFEYKDTLHSNRIALDGSKIYLARIYDTVLTEAQVMQNHFADLCYYYGLDGAEQLALYSDVILDNSFYAQFANYEIGHCDSAAISAMQTYIDNALAKISNIDKNAAMALLDGAYQEIVASEQSMAAALSKINGFVSDIQGFITQINGIVAENDKATAIKTEKIESIQKVLTAITKEQGKILMANIKNGDLVAEANTIYASIGQDSANEDILAAYKQINLLIVTSTEYVNESVFCADNSVEIKDMANADVMYALSANAIATTDGTDFIKYLGMQIRITDYASMRAVFSVNESALASGYTYGQNTYNIVASGMLYGSAASGFDALTVSYVNGKVIAGAGVTVRGFESRYGVNVDANGRGFADGEEYAIETSFATVAASQMKDAVKQEYAYRAFLVFEGAQTSYIVYVDGANQALGNGTSIYELAKAVAAMPNIEPAWLAETNYIAKVIAYAGNED